MKKSLLLFLLTLSPITAHAVPAADCLQLANLMSQGCSINAKNCPDLQSPEDCAIDEIELMWACINGDFETINAILNHGREVSYICDGRHRTHPRFLGTKEMPTRIKTIP